MGLAFRPFRERRKGQVGLSSFRSFVLSAEEFPAKKRRKGGKAKFKLSFRPFRDRRKGGKAKSAYRPFGLSAFPLKISPRKNDRKEERRRGGKEERPSSSWPFVLSGTSGKEERQ